MSLKKIDLLYHFSGNILVKSLPILFGLLLSKEYGNSEYVKFVGIMITANLIVSIGVSGFIPQFLLNNTDPKKSFTLFSLSQIFVTFLILLYYVYNIVNNSFDLFTFIFILTYTYGYSLLCCFTSLLNGKKLYKTANLFWFAIFGFSTITSLTMIMLKSSVEYIFISFSIIYFIGGILILLYSKLNNYINYTVCYGQNTLKIYLNSLYVSFFASSTLLGFKLILFYIDSEKDNEIFSFGYHLFSMIIFIPLILGGIVIPIFSKKTGKSEKNQKIFISIYLLSSIIIVIIGLNTLKLLFNIYSLEYNIINRYTIYLIFTASIVTSVNTYYIHFFNSLQKYKNVFFAGLIWLFCIISVISYYNFSLTSINGSISVLLGYFFSSIYLIISKKYIHVK